jgi:AcrR family transcriptional regulator
MLPNSRSGNAVDPRVKRTRKLIEQTFEELLDEKGFQALTVQNIADRATVNRATFYGHFEDKYALLDSYIRESFQQWLTATVPASTAFSTANVRQLAVAVFGYLDPLQGARLCRSSERQALEPIAVTAMQEELYRFLLDRLQDSALPRSAAGRPRTAETIATVVSWAIFGAALQWARGERGQPIEEVAGQVVDTLIAGLSGIVATPTAGQPGRGREAMALASGR